MAATNIINMAMSALSFFWALLIIALTGNYIASGGNSAMINYDLFCGIFGMLCLFYLIPASFKDSLAFHPAIPMALNGLNMLFWFIGGVATAAYLHVHSCSRPAYYLGNHTAGGSEKKCREAQATTAFLWFGFASFAAAMALSFFSGRSGGAGRPGVRRGPAMSQV